MRLDKSRPDKMRLYIKKRPIYIYFLSLFITSNTLQNIYKNALQSYIFWWLWNMCNINTYSFYDFLCSKPCFHLLPANVPLIRYTFIFQYQRKYALQSYTLNNSWFHTFNAIFNPLPPLTNVPLICLYSSLIWPTQWSTEIFPQKYSVFAMSPKVRKLY